MNSRRRKIYLSLIAIGLVALVIDRLFILHPTGGKGGPARAVASAIVRAGESKPTDASDVVGRWNVPKLIAIPDKWRDLMVDSARTVRDPFVASTELAPEADEIEDETETETEAAAPTVSFAERHAVEAVLVTPQGPQAIVDGRILKVGDWIDGHRVERIDTSSVVFQGVDETVTLHLPQIELRQAHGGP